MPPKKIPSPGDEPASPSNLAGSSSSSSSSDSSVESEPEDSRPVHPRGRRLMAVADEVLLLEAVLSYKEKHGRMPPPRDLAAELQWSEGRLYSAEHIASQLQSLRVRSYATDPKTEDQVYRLSKSIWPPKSRPHKRKRPAHLPRQDPPRGFGELAELYPNLAGVVEENDGGSGGCKGALGWIADETAAALEEKGKSTGVARSRVRAEYQALAGKLLLKVIK